ncbi:MAG: hypothetical protein ACT4OZ_16605 [Gemmatimonadota bacterium]
MVRRWTHTLFLVAFAACGGSAGDGGGGPGPGTPPGITDAQVSALARASAGWTWYKNRGDTLLRSAGSGHAEARLRTRFNAIAATQLGSDGKVRAGASFPDSSLIVKELIIGGALNRYAVMMKLRSSSLSGGGWLWAYYAPDGSTQIGITGRGGSCVGCHSSGIDHVRMNDSHP